MTHSTTTADSRTKQHIRRRRLRMRQRRGATVLEMGIVLLLLLMITFGIMDWAWVFYVRSTMYHAGREAARAMAVQEQDAAAGQAIAEQILNASHSSLTFDIQVHNTTDPEIRVNIGIPIDQAGITRLPVFTGLTSKRMTALVIMRREGL